MIRDFAAWSVTVEALGVWTGLLCVWLYVRENAWSWPIGIANNVFFGWIFLEARLYSDLILQIIYAVISIYGWYEWLRGGEGRTVLQVSRTPRAFALGGVFVIIVGTPLFALGVLRLAAVSGLPAPDYLFWDAATTVTCLVAQTLLAKKCLENWPIWIATNVSYIALYSAKGLFAFALLQVVWIAMSVKGWLEWRRSLAASEAAPAVAGP